MRRHQLTAIVLSAAFAATLRAQQPQPTPAQTPVFKSSVELIAIDAHVMGRDGRPVADLDPGQFDVLIDGKTRRVVTAQYLRDAVAQKASPQQDELPIEATFSSNEQAAAEGTSRLVVLLIDQASFTPATSKAAIDAARRVLDRLGPADKVSLATFPGPGPRMPFTSNHAQVRAALDRVIGLAEPWPILDPYFSMSEAIGLARGDRTTRTEVLDRECSARGDMLMTPEGCARTIDSKVPVAMSIMRRQVEATVFGLQRIVDALASIDGPKTGVFITTGLIAGERLGDMDTDSQLRSLARSAAVARVNLCVLHIDNAFVEGFSVDRPKQSAEMAFRDGDLLTAGLEVVALQSGGVYQKLAAASPAPFDRLARELSAAYLLGVEPAASDRDGKAHRIQVRVKVPGATVRSRTELLVPTQTVEGPSDEERLASAVTSPQMTTGLPLRLSHVCLREADGRVRIVISVAVGRGLSRAETVKIGYVVYDASGKVTGHAAEAKTLQPVGPAEDASLSFMEAMTVAPGDYLLKFAAIDAKGRVGSVFHNIDARLAATGGVSTSDLLLVDPSRRADTGVLLPIADGRVVGLSIGAYLEVYGETARSQPAVSVEIADRPNGKPLVGATLPVAVRETGTRWSAEGVLDLSLLPPGQYVASAVVTDGDQRLAAVTRPFRLEPRAGAAALNVTVAPRAGFAALSSGLFVRGFARTDALSRDALGFFLARLQEADASMATGATADAAVAIKEGRFDAATAALRDATSDQLAASFLKGIALFASGDLEAAAGQFRTALRVSNDFMPAVFYLGACYAAGGRDREAVGAWQTSLVTESEARIVFDVLADALLRLQDGAQAVAILGEARDRWPDDDLFLPRLAAAQALQKQRADALATISPYIDRHPADTNALVMALRVLYESHQAGRVVISQSEDRARATKFGDLYRSAGGAEQALVDRWVAFIGRSGAK
jgi:VWFA-related protein